MDGFALLRGWPGFEKANAETLFASPAWRVETEFGGSPATMERSKEPIEDPLRVDVLLDDEPHVLALCDTEAFPDLHRLWARRAALPRELLLALVEKECGSLFQVVEGVLRKRFSIKGLADDGAESGALTTFRLKTSESALSFAVDLNPLLVMTLGQFKNIDLGHEAIRGLRAEAWVEYAAVDLLESELSALAPGDWILIPENVEANWRMDGFADGRVHVCAADPGEVTFAQVSDGEWPETPAPDRLVLKAGGRIVARGAVGQLGLQRAFKVEEVTGDVQC